MVEVIVRYDPAKGQVQVAGPTDQMPVTCIAMLEDGARILRDSLARAEQQRRSNIVVPTLKLNGPGGRS